MFVSFEVSNIGPFKDSSGITMLADSKKKEFLDYNSVEINGSPL